MVAEPLDVRMAKLEGATNRSNERLGGLSGEVADLRRQMNTQFYWLLTFVLGSIIIPILRDAMK